MPANLLEIALPKDVEILQQSIIQLRAIMRRAYETFLPPELHLTKSEAIILEFLLAHDETASRQRVFCRLYSAKQLNNKKTRNSFSVHLSNLRSKLKNSIYDVRIIGADSLKIIGPDKERLKQLAEPSRRKLVALEELLMAFSKLPNDVRLLQHILLRHMELLRGRPQEIAMRGVSLSSSGRIFLSILKINHDRIVTWQEVDAALYPPYGSNPPSLTLRSALLNILRSRLAASKIEIATYRDRGVGLTRPNGQRLLALLKKPKLAA